MELVQIFTIMHSATCLSISIFVFMLLRKNTMFQKKQYYLVLGISLFVTILYFASLVWLVISSTNTFRGTSPIMVIKNILDFLSSISTGTFSFVFAVIMNFVLLSFIFCLNMASAVVSDLIRTLEIRRTGGMGTNELELNRLSVH